MYASFWYFFALVPGVKVCHCTWFQDRKGDKFMKKQTIKTILAALTAAAMVCSMAGCSGKDAGTAESSASGSSAAAENTGAAAENGKDSVIVVMGPSSEPEAGFDPAYGARPLRRAIQNEIEDMLSEEIIDGNIKSGDSITVDVEDDKFTVKK